MMRFTLLLFMVLLSGTGRLAAQEKVEARDITPVIKLDEVIFGHLNELNGKFKMRATEVTFAPDGYLGVHHHVGPGIRYVLSGELTFTEGGHVTVYKAGDYFFETGNSRTYRSEQDEFAASHIICGDSSKGLGRADGCSTFGAMSLRGASLQT